MSVTPGEGTLATGARQPLPARLQRWLWRDVEQEPRWRRELVAAVRLVFAVWRDLAAGQLTLRAMSLVYTTLLSLVPLLAISFSILKGFGVHNQIEPFLLTALEPLGDRAAAIAEQIIQFVDNMQVGVLGFVGLVLLFYTVLSLMQKVESAFNEVWQVTRERSMAERFRDYLSVIVVGPVLVFTSLGVTASFFASRFMQGLLVIGPIGTLFEFAGRLVPVLMVVAAFTFIYVFVPNTRVRLPPALFGGFVAGVLWNLLGLVFATFVASASQYTAIYSGFATPILFMIWLYLGWMVLLLGACIAFYRQHPEYLAGRQLAANLSFLEREHVALHTLVTIGERYYGSRPPISVDELALELAVPTEVVEQLLGILARDGLIAPTDEEPPRFLPACPWEQVTLAQALEAVRRARTGPGGYTGSRSDALEPTRLGEAGDARSAAEHPSVRGALLTLERVTHEAFGDLSLKAFTTGEPESAAPPQREGTDR